MSKLTEVELDEEPAIQSKFSPEEIDKQYKDYRAKRKASRTSHKVGDTAVMGMREKLDLPYWIHKCLITLPEWCWVWEPYKKDKNAGTTKFLQIFPEFGAYEIGSTMDIKKEEVQVRYSDLWLNYETAKLYLEKGYAAWKTR